MIYKDEGPVFKTVQTVRLDDSASPSGPSLTIGYYSDQPSRKITAWARGFREDVNPAKLDNFAGLPIATCHGEKVVTLEQWGTRDEIITCALQMAVTHFAMWPEDSTHAKAWMNTQSDEYLFSRRAHTETRDWTIARLLPESAVGWVTSAEYQVDEILRDTEFRAGFRALLRAAANALSA